MLDIAASNESRAEAESIYQAAIESHGGKADAIAKAYCDIAFSKKRKTTDRDKMTALSALVDLRGDRPATRSELSGSLHLDTPGVLTPEEQAARVAELLRSELAKSTGGV